MPIARGAKDAGLTPAPRWRDVPTRDLLDECEHWRWLWAELVAIKARLSVKWFFETSTPVTLHRAGLAWRGCCPIHHGANPTSLVVSDAWYCCHSCGAKEDLVTAAMRIFALDRFGTAVEVLAVMAGIARSARPEGFFPEYSLVLVAAAKWPTTAPTGDTAG